MPTVFGVRGRALVADVPRSMRFRYREHELTLLPIDGFRVILNDESSASMQAGVATLAITLADSAGFSFVGILGVRELHVDVDDVPLVTTTLTPRGLPLIAPTPPEYDPDTGEPLPPRTDAEIDAAFDAEVSVTQIQTGPGEFPLIQLCGGGHATLEFDIHPWPTDPSDIEAVVVTGDLSRLIEGHYRDRLPPAHEVPLIVTRDEWRVLLARDATERGYRGAPSLTLAREDHTATLGTAVGEGSDAPEFNRGVVLVGVFDERSASAAVGAVRVLVTPYRCQP